MDCGSACRRFGLPAAASDRRERPLPRAATGSNRPKGDESAAKFDSVQQSFVLSIEVKFTYRRQNKGRMSKRPIICCQFIYSTDQPAPLAASNQGSVDDAGYLQLFLRKSK